MIRFFVRSRGKLPTKSNGTEGPVMLKILKSEVPVTYYYYNFS